MPFVTIDPSLLDVGDPVTKDLFDTIKDNLDDLSDRLLVVEGNIAKITVFNDLFINGLHTVLSGIDQVSLYKAETDFVLTSAKVVVLVAGTAGTLEIDVKKSSTIGGTFTSIFSTRPSLSFSAGSNVESSNAVFSTTTVSAGDYLRLDVTSIQTAQKRFFIHVFGEAS